MALKIRRLSNSLGAEILGIDLRREQDDETRAQLRQAFRDHQVLLLRDQDITPQQHIAFTRIFGQVDGNDAVPDYRHPDYREVVVVSNEKKNGRLSPTRDIGRQWHSDHSMTTRPTLGSILHAQVVPDVGGDTMFTNMYRAYETLSPTLQRMLEPLGAIHDALSARHLKNRPAAYLAEKRALVPPVEQPVVRVHPETGKKALYVSEMMNTTFVGMTEEESLPLLQYLFSHSVRPEFTYRHQWRRHDLVMWDNRCTMHNALADFDPDQTRVMFRTALVGEPCGKLVEPLPA